MACEKVEIKALLAEIEAIGKLAKADGERFLSLGKVALLTELMDLAGKAGVGAGTTSEAEG